MSDREVMQQALEALVQLDGLDTETECVTIDVGDVIAALKAALEQQPVQEPVSMRMPKVGDRIVCLEDESLGEVVSLTAGGSPDILFDDGSHGTYLLREFAELFGYVNSPQQQAKPFSPEAINTTQTAWKMGYEAAKAEQQAEPVMINGLTEAETATTSSVVGLTKQAEPVVWDKPSDDFNAWWDSDLRNNANPFATDSIAYWAWEGWQAALRSKNT